MFFWNKITSGSRSIIGTKVRPLSSIVKGYGSLESLDRLGLVLWIHLPCIQTSTIQKNSMHTSSMSCHAVLKVDYHVSLQEAQIHILMTAGTVISTLYRPATPHHRWWGCWRWPEYRRQWEDSSSGARGCIVPLQSKKMMMIKAS